MHAAFFGLKRAHWGGVGTTRKPLLAFGLTAARFDLLYVLKTATVRPTRQRSIHRALGCTAQVVSRMLKSLRELGLVTRMRRPTDTREWLIGLTSRGRFAIRDAIEHFIEHGHAERIVEQGLCPKMLPGVEREDEAFEAMSALETLLDNLREGFVGRGTLYYPWHPDD